MVDTSGKNGPGNDQAGDGGSFEARLRSARIRQGMDAVPVNPERSAGAEEASPLGIGLRVGSELVSALAVAAVIGWVLDRWLHTRPLFLALSVVLGGVAGVLNVWRLVGPASKK